MSPRGIVVGVDGSAASVCALRWAADHAELLDVPLEAVLVSVEDQGEDEQALAAALAATVDSAVGAPELRRRVSQDVLRGPLVDVLVERSRGASLLVLGRPHGRHSPRLTTLTRCIRHAACPVAVIPVTAPRPHPVRVTRAPNGDLGDRPVRDVMTPTVLAILPSTSVDVALQIMAGAGIHHLPVMEHGACLGLLHETDAVWHLASRSSSERRLTAGEAVRGPVATVAPDATVRQAAERMFASSGDALVVVEDEQVVGILTANDLLAVLAGHERGPGPRHDAALRAIDGGQRRERTHTTRPVEDQTPVRSSEPESERTIVVGVDGSPASREALSWAVDYARRLGYAVRAVSVCSLVSPAAFMPAGGAPMEDPDVLIQAHEEQLDAVVREVDPGSRGVSVQTSVILSDPGPGLCAVAANAPALVLGSRGRGKVLSALLGSVSAYCVRHARAAVVVIPPAAVADGSADLDLPEEVASEPTPAGVDPD